MAIAHRLGRLAGVREDETAVVWRIAAIFGLLEVGRALGDAGAGGLLINREPGLLPGLFIPLGILSLVVAMGFGAALSRIRRARLLAGCLVAIGLLLGLEWVALSVGMETIALVWLTVSAAGTLAMTIGWTVAGSSLDARQAKRLFPLCTSAAIVGYLVGSLAAGVLAPSVGAAALIAVEALLFALAAVVIGSLARRSTASGWRLVPSAGTSIGADVLVGFEEVRRSPLLRLIAVAYVLLAVLMFSVSYPYWLAVRAAFPDEAQLTSILGLVSAIATGVSLVVALVVANQFYARFGVATAALVLPIVYLAGFGVWIVRLTFPTAAAVAIVQQVTQRGLSNAAWSAFYNVVPASRRAQVLAFMDGVPGQAGTILSGVLLLTVGRVLAPEQVAWLGLVTAAVAVGVVVAIRRRYADALVRTLRSGIGEQLLEGGPGPVDMLAVPEVRAALAASMSAPEPAIRSLAASLLARSDATDARGSLVDALDDPDPVVAAEAIVGILRDGMLAGDPVGTPGPVARAERRLAALLGGDEPARVVGLRAAHRLGRIPDAGLRAAMLADPSAAVRSVGLEMLGDDPDPAAGEILVEALGDPMPLVRRSAAAALAGRPTLQPGIVDRLLSGSDDAQDAAVHALLGHGPAARGPVLAWAEAAIERASELGAARSLVAAEVTADEPGVAGRTGAATAFLVRTLDHRIGRAHERVLAAMAVLGAPAARGVIRRCLRSTDADVRAQALEALDSIGDRQLGSALTRLIEAGSGALATVDADTTWHRLRDDVDPWIRGLSRLSHPSGADMPDPERALGDIETMLRLRRVPLFERMAPEDLQRLAAVATHRSFERGDVLMREHDPGDEMFVIVDGIVAVTREEPDGTVRRIRTYQAGDHIGELAVLRERPRAATVTAEGGPVLALVVGGDGLRAILLERPEAAMAMLATLAERISVQ